jgi:hypothetical protein
MPTRTSYTQGTPNWVDLQTPDRAAAKAFYAGLFGWTYDDQPMGRSRDRCTRWPCLAAIRSPPSLPSAPARPAAG